MRPILLLGSACCLWFAGTAFAQENPPSQPGNVEAELREIRELIEQQNRKLDALSRQFSALKDFVASNGTIPMASGKAAAGKADVTSDAPAPTQGAAASAPSQPVNVPPTANAPGKHTVTKGETLTSIAKRYNIPLAELEKANPIQNDRMLQIGQTLTIPPNASAPAPAPTSPKAPEPPTQKKENP